MRHALSPAIATLMLLSTASAVSAHTAWLEPEGDHYLLRFGGHAGVLEDYPAEKLREVAAVDAQGQAVSLHRDDSDSGVRLTPEAAPALITLFFDNGYWARAPGSRSENRPMNEVPGATSAVHAVKYHKYIAQWSDIVTTAQGQPFELVPIAGEAPAAGEPVTFRVLVDGRHAAGIALAFEEAGREAVSDEQGLVSLTTRAGVNRIWAGLTREVPVNPAYTTLSIEYSLVFYAHD